MAEQLAFYLPGAIMRSRVRLPMAIYFQTEPAPGSVTRTRNPRARPRTVDWVSEDVPAARPDRPPARARAVIRPRKPGQLSRAGTGLLSSELEIQAEILNHGRYTDITERYCMTPSDTGHRNLTVKSLCDFSLLSLISSFKFCRCHADQYMLQT